MTVLGKPKNSSLLTGRNKFPNRDKLFHGWGGVDGFDFRIVESGAIGEHQGVMSS